VRARPRAGAVEDPGSRRLDVEPAGMPDDVGGRGRSAHGEDAHLDGEPLEQRRSGLLGPRGHPGLVGQRQRDVAAELIGQVPRGAGGEVGLVLDGDDPSDPVGVRADPAEFDPAATATGLDCPPVGRGVDRLAGVPPGVVGLGERVPVVGPLRRRVTDDVEQVRVERRPAEVPAGA